MIEFVSQAKMGCSVIDMFGCCLLPVACGLHDR
jgi:hypothetical protein